jgi:hypothetical protein
MMMMRYLSMRDLRQPVSHKLFFFRQKFVDLSGESSTCSSDDHDALLYLHTEIKVGRSSAFQSPSDSLFIIGFV